MNGEIIPVIYLIKERKRDYLYIIVFNVLIYRNEFINAMDHMYYPPLLPSDNHHTGVCVCVKLLFKMRLFKLNIFYVHGKYFAGL